ncbi:hypothetical protein TrVE_jg13461 [Triparma verrucosa]|uniref:Leucine-rich repeat-containing N-terminal plant-type domain-containing protein n=1 Tax=Triparma verrucosa TaxID=1606542 RepID=A0A9W7FD11_9STRA|nr:hypothetical protein TrVE_jg13461 [Triparma verrucosa]
MLPKVSFAALLCLYFRNTTAITAREAAREAAALDAIASLTNVRDVTSTGWEPSAALSRCEWEGVSCSGGSEIDEESVTELNLGGVGLTGRISTLVPALQNLTNLSELDFSFNHLVGSLPKVLVDSCQTSISCDFAINKMDCGGDFQILVAGAMDPDSQSCVFCRNCLEGGKCANGYDPDASLYCDVCPPNTFEKGETCYACSDALSSVLIPVGAFFALVTLVSLLDFVGKKGLKFFPYLGPSTSNMVRYKLLITVLQFLIVYSQFVGLQAPWFAGVIKQVTHLALPPVVLTPCFLYGSLASGPYYFLTAWLILGGVSLLVFLAINLHRVPKLPEVLGVHFFENSQKIAAIMIIQLPIPVTLASMKSTVMFNYGASIYGWKIFDSPFYIFANLLSLILIIFTMQRILKKLIRRGRRMREALIIEMEDVEEQEGEEEACKTILTDIENHRPFLAMFGIQYVSNNYRHEEKAFVRKVASVVAMSTIHLCVMIASYEEGVEGNTGRELKNSLLGASQSFALVLVNWVYLGDMLKRPYVSHSYMKRSEPFHESEIWVVRFSSWFLALHSFRLFGCYLLGVHEDLSARLGSVSCGVLLLGLGACMLPILKDVTEEPAEEGLRETEIVDEINRILNATSFRCAVYFSRAVSSSVKYDNDYKFELRRWPVSPPEEPHVCNILGCCFCTKACRKDIHACVNHNYLFKPLSWVAYVAWLSAFFWIVASSLSLVLVEVDGFLLSLIVCPLPLLLCALMEIRIFRSARKWKIDTSEPPMRESFGAGGVTINPVADTQL